MNDALWQSDAAAGGTHPIDDSILNGLSNIHALSKTGNRLYFSAYQFYLWQELYTATVEKMIAPAITAVAQSKAPLVAANILDAKLLNNPTAGQLNILVSMPVQQTVQELITDALGSILINASRILVTGTTVLSFHTSN